MDAGALPGWLTLLTDLAVIAGIVFLAVEVRQNSQNVASQARATYFASVADTWRIPAENPQLTEIMTRDAAARDLTQAEVWQIQAFWTRVQTALEWGYKELPRNEFSRGLEFQKVTFDLFPSYRAAWSEREAFFDPDFYRFMNENVFGMHNS